MARAYVDGELCKECLRCVRACPRQALSLLDKRNHMGYRTIGIAGQLCNGCGICYTMCPDCCFEIAQETGDG